MDAGPTDAYSQGREARRRGRAITTNPHDLRAEHEREAWRKGWIDEDVWVASHGGYLGQKLRAKSA